MKDSHSQNSHSTRSSLSGAPSGLLRHYFEKMSGGKRNPAGAPWHEVLISGIGALLGIYAVHALGLYKGVGALASVFLVGSFGASAVLIYGVPTSPYSQPRNLVGGHVISAVAGVACVKLIPDPGIAAAVAVAIALMLMHVTRTIHPPGGASALIAVVGGPEIHGLGFYYALTPILAGAVIMLAIALLVNNLSPHRRYPQFWY